MHACLHVLQSHMCRWVWEVKVDINCLPQLSSNFIFGGRVFHWIWSSPVELGLRDALSPLLRTDITGRLHTHPGFSVSSGDLNSSLHTDVPSALSTEPSPASNVLLSHELKSKQWHYLPTIFERTKPNFQKFVEQKLKLSALKQLLPISQPPNRLLPVHSEWLWEIAYEQSGPTLKHPGGSYSVLQGN